MNTTRVDLSFTRYDNDEGPYEERFELNFNLKDETLGVVFDKLEVFLNALGFVIEGKELRLVDREEDTKDTISGTFLTEDYWDSQSQFRVLHGNKKD